MLVNVKHLLSKSVTQTNIFLRNNQTLYAFKLQITFILKTNKYSEDFVPFSCYLLHDNNKIRTEKLKLVNGFAVFWFFADKRFKQNYSGLLYM